MGNLQVMRGAGMGSMVDVRTGPAAGDEETKGAVDKVMLVTELSVAQEEPERKGGSRITDAPSLSHGSQRWL